MVGESVKIVKVYLLYLDISKHQGRKKFLEILKIKNVIVQKGLLMLLQPMFIHGFYEFLYGFKFNYTSHKIFNVIRTQGNKTIWFIELNLVDVFEKLHYEVLLKKIRLYTDEQQIYNLISNILKVNYINSFNMINIKFNKKDKTFQSLILRSFFVNIFFDRFDKWVENYLFLKYNFSKKDYLKLNYLNIVDKYIGTESNEIFVFVKKRVSLFRLKKIRKVFCKVKQNQIVENKIKYYVTDSNYKKLWYVRYHTHMLFGLIGTKKDAVAIFDKIKVDLEKELSMKIPQKKVGINHYFDGVLFLGYRIFGSAGKTHYKVFYPRHIDQYYYFNLFFESLLRKCLVMSRYFQHINSWGFKSIVGGRVKGFFQLLKLLLIALETDRCRVEIAQGLDFFKNRLINFYTSSDLFRG